MPDKLYKSPYAWSTSIGECLTPKMTTFYELAEALKMDVTELMRQANGHAPPSKALVKGVAKEVGMDEKTLEKLTDEVRKDFA